MKSCKKKKQYYYNYNLFHHDSVVFLHRNVSLLPIQSAVLCIILIKLNQILELRLVYGNMPILASLS